MRSIAPNRSAADKQATLDLQKRIQQAVLTGSGWETLALYRRQADTPWFQSFLAFDPAKIMPDVKQPVLIVQGELDTQVAPVNADRLQALAAKRQERADGAGGEGARSQSSARACHDRRSGRVPQSEGQERQRGRVHGHRELASDDSLANEHVDSADVRPPRNPWPRQPAR